MSTELENIVRELKQSFVTVKEQLDKLTALMSGDPTDPSKPGIPIRLDRLEQSNKLKNKVLMLLATGIFTAFGSIALVAFGQLLTK